MGLFVIYLLIGWLLMLIKDVGLFVSMVVNVIVMFQIGGMIGVIGVGWLMDCVWLVLVIGVVYFGGGLCVVVFVWVGVLLLLFVLLVFVVGFCMSGVQIGLNVYVLGCYLIVVCVIGVSWMFGMGCFGSIFGLVIGGVLFGFGWKFDVILLMFVVLVMLVVIVIMMMQYVVVFELQEFENLVY